MDCRAVAVYGGAPKKDQEKVLRKGCEIIVATPGRLMDILNLHEDSSKISKYMKHMRPTSLECCKVGAAFEQIALSCETHSIPKAALGCMHLCHKCSQCMHLCEFSSCCRF